MAKKRKVQPVSFNVADDYERELLEYALQQQRFFSRYVKRLIEADRAGLQQPDPQPVPGLPSPAPVSPAAPVAAAAAAPQKVSAATAAGFL